jgi:hypothetical protein
MILHAFYSQKMADANGTFLYRNAEGKIIEATLITKDKHDGPAWDDTVYLGEVVEFVYRCESGSLNNVEPGTKESVKKIIEMWAREDQRNNDPSRWN